MSHSDSHTSTFPLPRTLRGSRLTRNQGPRPYSAPHSPIWSHPVTSLTFSDLYNTCSSHSSPTDLAVPSTGRAEAGHRAFALTQANSLTSFRFLLNY